MDNQRDDWIKFVRADGTTFRLECSAWFTHSVIRVNDVLYLQDTDADHARYVETELYNIEREI